MKLYKTYLKWKTGEIYEYEEQLKLLRNGDYQALNENVNDIKEIYLDDFERFVSVRFWNETLDLPDGIYRIKKQFDSDRYIYCEFLNSQIDNVYFDDYQINDVDELLEIEREKQDLLFEGVEDLESIFLDRDEMTEKELEQDDELSL